MSKVSVIGAGAWGTTLSILLAEKGHSVTLWTYEKELAPEIIELRENKKYLPGFQLPENIEITGEISQVPESDFYVFAVPTQFLRSTVKEFSKKIKSSSMVIS